MELYDALAYLLWYYNIEIVASYGGMFRVGGGLVPKRVILYPVSLPYPIISPHYLRASHLPRPPGDKASWFLPDCMAPSTPAPYPLLSVALSFGWYHVLKDSLPGGVVWLSGDLCTQCLWQKPNFFWGMKTSQRGSHSLALVLIFSHIFIRFVWT